MRTFRPSIIKVGSDEQRYTSRPVAIFPPQNGSDSGRICLDYKPMHFNICTNTETCINDECIFAGFNNPNNLERPNKKELG